MRRRQFGRHGRRATADTPARVVRTYRALERQWMAEPLPPAPPALEPEPEGPATAEEAIPSRRRPPEGER